ncbi:hypothetical protein FRC08_003272 [Ceratobasidium sp. 394]|nr:hypothetical protein FRC08_003272 [Ceratobasidium sp. 394]
MRFPRLHTAFIDSHNDFVLNTPQDNADIPQPIGYYRLVAPRFPATLQRIWLTNVHGPDARVIQSICQQCPRLKELWIERCTLFGPRMTGVAEDDEAHGCSFWGHFPNDHDAYFAAVGVDDYARSLASELVPLAELEQLHMGLYLTPFEALEAHQIHHQEGRIHGPIWGPTCQTCTDEFEGVTREAEQRATEALGHSLPGLKLVSWSSYYTPNKAGRSVYNLVQEQGVTCKYQGNELM